jgi:hypothetical protein
LKVILGGVMVKKYLVFICAAVFLVAHQAESALPPQLPESSHHEDIWFYDTLWSDDGFGELERLRGRIDFSVYDTLTYPDEFIGSDGYIAPGDGRYIYAYQIFNDYEGNSEESVAYFAPLGLEMDYVFGIGSQEDPADGIAPTEQYFFDEDDDGFGEAVWDFGYFEAGQILAGEHSQFLVYSSDIDWQVMNYYIGGPEPIPEPATLILFALGGLIIRRRR